MQESWENLKSKAKNALKKTTKKMLPIILIGLSVFSFLAASVYFVTIDDGTYKESDWSSTNYATSQYINNVSADLSEGTLINNTSVQELWDKMIENGSRVNEYLDKPEELARLMKAEIVTRFPDIREDPDKEIDWDKVIKNEDQLQGIIKFKRADENDKTTTMKYTDPETFQSYIDEYNESGSENAKTNALNHFTLKKGITTKSGLLQTIDGVQMQVIEDSGKITFYNGDGSAMEGGSSNALGWKLEDGQCALKGLREYAPYKSVIYIETKDSGEGSYANGKFFYVTDTGGGLASNQVDVYAKVSQSELNRSPYGTTNGARISLVEKDVTWEEYKEKYYGKTLGVSSNTNNSTNSANTTNTNKTEKTEKVTSTVTQVSGDGYSQEYTSSAGITYKHYKQGKSAGGSYAKNHYWDGTIASSGCGPTSVAILASGLLNSNYTPGDIAAEMDSKYGKTSYETLKGEMDSLGMISEVIQSPSASQIQDNLRNGKVMLVSVNSNTDFTGKSHIMAIVDINSEGQVYICNPSGSGEGWYDVSEIMKGCKYIVVTDAGAVGVARATRTSNYVAVVASWTQIDTTLKTDDPEVEGYSKTEYSMTTTEVNYEEMVSSFTMPFDLLWAFLVVGEEKEFVLDLADLVYDSDIQITVYDNLTVNTDIDDWNYKQRMKAICEYYDVKATFREIYTARKSGRDHIDDPYGDDILYNTVKTVITQTNTISPVLTKANVWYADYTNEYTYAEPNETTQSDRITKKDTEYTQIKENPDYLENKFECEHINVEEIKKELIRDIAEQYIRAGYTLTQGEPNISTKFEESYYAKYYKKYIDISDTITNKVSTKKYTQGSSELNEKIDRNSKEPNFVTIFNKFEHRANKKNIMSVNSWLFEIIEKNESTADMLDLVKYLLYKSTGKSFGVDTFDVNAFFKRNLTTVGAGDYVVHTEKSSSDIVITDLNKLKRAFSGYKGNKELQQYASYFLEYQEKYKVNAVFAAAVSITETSAGRAGHAIDGKNNWFNIECTCKNSSHGRFETYSSAQKSIEKFFKQIAEGSYYFTKGNYTVSSIGMIYCENADKPGGWIEVTNTYMTEMFNAAGIDVSFSAIAETETGAAIVAAARSKLGCPYVWGATGPNSFDCSGLTQWCYKQAGINIPRTSSEQKRGAIKVVPVSEARVGDVLWKQGHVALYIGNGQLIEAPRAGKDVCVSSKVNRFTCALQFY